MARPLTPEEMAPENTAQPILGNATGDVFTPGAAPDTPEYTSSFRPNRDQVWQEQVDLNSLNSIVGIPGRDGMEGVGIRALTEWQARDQGKQYTGKELNTMFPDLPTENKFSDAEKLNLYQATLRVENLNRIQEKKNWMSMGAPLGTWDNLTAGAMQGLDPVNLLAGALFGGSNLAYKALGNVAGNLLVDIPTTSLLRRENQKVAYMETVIGSVAGGLVGTAVGEALTLGAKGLVHGMAKVMDKVKGQVDTMPASTRAMALGTARAQLDVNAKVDLDRVITPHVDKLSGKIASDVEAAPIIPGVTDSVAYSVSHPDSATPMHMGNDYGPGKYLTTDSAKANSLASNAEGSTVGKITSHGIGADTKFLDIDTPYSNPKMPPIIDSILEKMGLSKADISEDGNLTLREILDNYDGSAADIHAAAKESGFDGLEWADGADGHKAKLLFDESAKKINDVADIEAAKDMSIKTDKQSLSDVIDDAGRKENNIFYDEEAVKTIDEQASKALDDPIEEDRLIAAMDEMEKKILADPASDPELLNAIDSVRKEFSNAEKDRKIFQDLANCILGKKI